ncbi:MAG: helix-turn-helix transcriptional regulator [Ruminiclostridium sp.]|nr:helix-turn-helix transcriptional regulator [Ruminiclostridium sp.]
MNDAFDFGLILKGLRKEKGWTQEELANKINKESSIISRYEKNLQSPTFDTVRAFSALFNVSMDYLSGMERQSNISTVGLNEKQRNIITQLIEQFRERNEITSKQLTDKQSCLLGRILAEFLK